MRPATRFQEAEIMRISAAIDGTRSRIRTEQQSTDRRHTPQDQDQDSLLVKRRNDNHSPGPVIRELVPSSHQRSELSNTILCIFSR